MFWSISPIPTTRCYIPGKYGNRLQVTTSGTVYNSSLDILTGNFSGGEYLTGDVFIQQPNLQPYIAPIPGILCEPPVDPALVPECKNAGNRPITAAVKPLHDGAWWAQATKGFNFKHPDMVNSDLFNRVLWKGIMGDDKPYPGAAIQQVNTTPIKSAATVADRD